MVCKTQFYFPELPQVEFSSKLHNIDKPRFYGEIMPNCEGLPSNWKFKIDAEFVLDAGNKEEYYLHLNQNQV